MAVQLSPKAVFTGSSGFKLPVIGLGTLFSKDLDATVETALEAGYPLIDTAFNYYNEDVIGKVLNKWFSSGKLKREDIFITTKLPFQAMDAKYVREYLEKSLKKLQLDYVDLFLVHHPIGFKHAEVKRTPDGGYDFSNLELDMTTDHVAIWKEMEKQVDAGLTKSIGLSNFNIKQIERVLKNARIPPVNLQIELQLYNQSKELRAFCRSKGITVTSYSTLGSAEIVKSMSKQVGSPLSDPVVARIAKAHGKTPAQVLLRHMLQSGVAIIPKSANPDRIRQNLQVFDFELSTSEMKELDSLDKGEAGRIFGNPRFQPHPEYPYPK